jgi:chromosome segregation ATPase
MGKMLDFNTDLLQLLITGATGGAPVTGLVLFALRMLKKSFDRLNDRIEGLGKEVATLNTHVGALDSKIESLGRELKAYTDRLIRVETVINEKIVDDVKELKDRVRSLETQQIEWRQ